jgi:hypothetical protein
MAVLTPLRVVLPQIETNRTTLTSHDPTPTRELASVFLNLLSSSVTLTGRIFLSAKDQWQEGERLNGAVAVGRDVLIMANTGIEKTRGVGTGDKKLLELADMINGVLNRCASEVSQAGLEGKDF